ncbi:hypothetical protein Tco_0564034 [Tanacetum coccineum]
MRDVDEDLDDKNDKIGYKKLMIRIGSFLSAFKVLASANLHVKEEELEVFKVIKEILMEVKVTKEEFHGTKEINTLHVLELATLMATQFTDAKAAEAMDPKHDHLASVVRSA